MPTPKEPNTGFINASNVVAEKIRHLESIDYIIPGLNEYDNLIILIPELVELSQQLKLQANIIIVDDGSTDDSASLYQQFKHLESSTIKLQLLELSRNFGKEYALTAGLNFCEHQACVILDADRQHPLEMIPKMIDMWEKGFDNVYTVQQSRKTDSFFKKIFVNFFYLVIADRSNPPIQPNAGDFRLLDNKIVIALCQMPEKLRFMKGLYSWVGFNSCFFYYQALPRTKGTSKFNFFRLLTLALNGITSFSLVPIRLTTIAGLILSIFGFAFAVWLTVSYLLRIGIKDYSAIFALQVMLTGFVLFTLGIIGEYIGHIYTEVKQRPIYLIKNHHKNQTEYFDQSKINNNHQFTIDPIQYSNQTSNKKQD